MNKQLSRGGFTLVELLVVITIIGILAGIALPVFQKVQINAEQTKVLANAKQIGLALKLFAGDYDGSYPKFADEINAGTTPVGDANEAYANLIPTYVPSEKIFAVKKSAYTPAAPDESFTTVGNRLAAGENHFAYVSNLTDTSNPNFPVVADGFSGTVGTYTNVQTDPGGVWEGRKAVVIRVDQSGKVETCNATYQVFGQTGTGTPADIFATGATWLGATQTPLNPVAAP
ncbi:MAG TPA: type II secretion system protein [Chthoniobacterales bacterium]